MPRNDQIGRGKGTTETHMATAMRFSDFFAAMTGNQAHPWQQALGDNEAPADRLIRIPTGLGKTAGTVLAWLWHASVRNDGRWPRRLVFCLPMRVLVEQTEAAVRGWLIRLSSSKLSDGRSPSVHVLMGGADAGEWHLHPEKPAIVDGNLNPRRFDGRGRRRVMTWVCGAGARRARRRHASGARSRRRCR